MDADFTGADYAPDFAAVDFAKMFLTWCESVTFCARAVAINVLMKASGRRTLIVSVRIAGFNVLGLFIRDGS